MASPDYEQPEHFDPENFFYGPGSDKAGMRCVARMSEDELRQSICRMIHFGLWHQQYQAGVYARQGRCAEPSFGAPGLRVITTSS